MALAGDNEHEIPELIRWAHGKGMDLTLIETMPLGDTEKIGPTGSCLWTVCATVSPVSGP